MAVLAQPEVSIWKTTWPYVVIGASVAVLAAVVKIARWTKGVDDDANVFKGFSRDIKDDLKEIKQDIKGIRRDMPSLFVQPGSPLALTDLRKEVAQQLEAHQWAARVAPQVRTEIGSGDPYDVQEFCINYVHSDLDADTELNRRINTAAFDHGVRRTKILDVLAIVLRDELLGQYPPSGALPPEVGS